MGWKATAGPSVEPMLVADAKLHLKVLTNNEDTLITNMITAAREEVENYCNISLVEQTIEESFPCFPVAENYNTLSSLWLSVSPLISIDSISYIDTDGNSQTLATTVYDLDDKQKPGKVTLKHNQTWPSTAKIENAVTITYKAGYGTTAADVPQAIKQAMLLMLTNWFEKRADDPQTPFARKIGNAQWLLDKYRVNVFV